MLEEMNWKKFLTENALGECWDADQRPGGDLPNRTFDNQDDMMELYKAIYRDRKWIRFADFVFKYYKDVPTTEIFDAWLFCLGDEDYESRCKLVAEFCGWEEYK